jgi:hypothetical protein
LSKTATDYTFDLSSVDSTNADTLKLTLNLQCRDLFNSSSSSEQSGTGSGMVFGKSGNNYSLMLVLMEKNVTDSGFAYAAKVTDKGSTDEVADMIFAEARPSGSTYGARNVVARVRAKQKKGIFEMVLGSTYVSALNSTSGTSSNMGCGIFGITDGTYIYAKGEYRSSGSCTGTPNMEICLNASTGNATASGDVSACNTLKASMTIGTAANLETLDSTVVTTADQTAMATAIKLQSNALDNLTKF